MVSRILIAHDLSPHGERAFAEGVRLAKLTGASVVLVHAEPPPAGTQPGLDGPFADVDPAAVDQAHARLERWAKRIRDEGLQVETVLEATQPENLILETAAERGADLIVMGTHGRTGLRRLVMGSVAEAVLRHAGRPVLVVPPPEDGGEPVLTPEQRAVADRPRA